MKLSEFIMLTEEEKRSMVLEEGVAIAKMDVNNRIVFLFQLPHFYVETHCCTATREILEYTVYHNAAHLTPYLEAIPIHQLLKKK